MQIAVCPSCVCMEKHKYMSLLCGIVLLWQQSPRPMRFREYGNLIYTIFVCLIYRLSSFSISLREETLRARIKTRSPALVFFRFCESRWHLDDPIECFDKNEMIYKMRQREWRKGEQIIIMIIKSLSARQMNLPTIIYSCSVCQAQHSQFSSMYTCAQHLTLNSRSKSQRMTIVIFC